MDVRIGLALACPSLEGFMPGVIQIFFTPAALCDSNDGPNTLEDRCKSPTSGMRLSTHHNFWFSFILKQICLKSP